MGKVDKTFMPRRRAQIFAELTYREDSIAAAKWLQDNVPEEERDELFIKYLGEELRKYEPTD